MKYFFVLPAALSLAAAFPLSAISFQQDFRLASRGTQFVSRDIETLNNDHRAAKKALIARVMEEHRPTNNEESASKANSRLTQEDKTPVGKNGAVHNNEEAPEFLVAHEENPTQTLADLSKKMEETGLGPIPDKDRDKLVQIHEKDRKGTLTPDEAKWAEEKMGAIEDAIMKREQEENARAIEEIDRAIKAFLDSLDKPGMI